MPPIERAAARDGNNFDALRLFAAGLVILTHSFFIAEGSAAHEPLVRLSGNQAQLGHLGVFMFFVISGFLVTESCERTGEPLRFLAKRALRIFPGLFAALLVTAFVIGPLVTALPLAEYLGRDEIYAYVVGNALLNTTAHTLPGVLMVDNPVGLELNGSLWTLRYEFMMYLMVMVLGALRLLDLRALLALLALGLACHQVAALGALGMFGWLLPFFAMGMVLAKLRHRRIFDDRLVLLAAIGLTLTVVYGQLIALFALFGGYLTLFLAFDRRLPLLRAARFGDLSYGIYIYGWPVTALLMRASGGTLAWWQLFALALPLAALTALLSWHLVEAPALSLKPKRAAAPPLAPALAAALPRRSETA
jgi:peptidoglycan/LPS O-acetylase OafA/YrhL